MKEYNDRPVFLLLLAVLYLTLALVLAYEIKTKKEYEANIDYLRQVYLVHESNMKEIRQNEEDLQELVEENTQHVDSLVNVLISGEW